MTLPVALRGTRVADAVGFQKPQRCERTLLMQHWGLELSAKLWRPPYFLNWLLFGSLFACAGVGLTRRRRWLWYFTFPSVYAFSAYAALTHFIPRYSVPLVPIVFATLALCVYASFHQLIVLRRAAERRRAG